MSSILKALRKLEDEKASLGEGNVDLAHDILKRSYDEPRATPWALILSGSMLVLLLAGAGWWIWRSQEQQHSVDLQVSQPVAKPAQVRVELVKKNTEGPLKMEKPLSSVVDRDMPPVLSGEISSQRGQAVEIEKTPVPVQVLEPEPIDIPDLRIDEIVYHQRPDSRLAVINDLPVMQGTDIDGAHVEEILSDRVRFSFKGVRFNKFLSSAGER